MIKEEVNTTFVDYDKYFGIYQILNTVNNKCYIGSTGKSFRKRWKDHLSGLRSNRHDNPHLQRSFNKYKEENFIFNVLEVLNDEKTLINRESYWIERLKSNIHKNGYNIGDAEEGRLISTEETRRKMSESRIGIVYSEDTKRKMSEAKKGKKLSPEHCKKIGNSNLGRIIKEETRQKMKQKALERPNHGMTKSCRKTARIGARKNLGKKQTSEFKKKCSESRNKNNGIISQKLSQLNGYDWLITFPDGHEEQIHSLTKFCRENNLNLGNMLEVSKGNRSHCNRYKVVKLTISGKKQLTDENKLEIYNIWKSGEFLTKDLCKRFDISGSTLYRIIHKFHDVKKG